MSQLDQYEMGIGTWAWGDKGVWGFGQGYDGSDLRETFLAAVSAGNYFFDTAEIYGDGLSETYLGRFMKERPDVTFYTATKFMPFPWKVSTSYLLKSLKASLKRLDLKQVELYQIHFGKRSSKDRIIFRIDESLQELHVLTVRHGAREPFQPTDLD